MFDAIPNIGVWDLAITRCSAVSRHLGLSSSYSELNAPLGREMLEVLVVVIGLTGPDTLQSMRKQVNKFIHNGLIGATGHKTIAMNWVQYWKAIVLKRGVILKGWPLEGEVKSPANIHDVESMAKLRDALQSGRVLLAQDERDEREEAQEKYDEMVDAGEIEVKVRKPRNDKGKPREKESEGLSTRSKGKDSADRRRWDEDSDSDVDEDKAERKKQKQKEQGKKSEKEKKAVSGKRKTDDRAEKAAKSTSGKRRAADNSEDTRPSKHKSSTRKEDDSTSHNSSSRKRKSAPDDDNDDHQRKKRKKSTSKSSTSTSSSMTTGSSRFNDTHAKLRALVASKKATSSVSSKLPLPSALKVMDMDAADVKALQGRDMDDSDDD
ncbi:hypothetical protein B0H14DRAFT_3758300 [Mycena olivaceomarginata]|nr:hypothetical protein B0H14DRAFT_3758300 [Mycena olivaceomarginata]